MMVSITFLYIKNQFFIKKKIPKNNFELLKKILKIKNIFENKTFSDRFWGS